MHTLTNWTQYLNFNKINFEIFYPHKHLLVLQGICISSPDIYFFHKFNKNEVYYKYERAKNYFLYFVSAPDLIFVPTQIYFQKSD